MARDTPLGITYPEKGDHTRLWEHYQNLAEDVDRILSTPTLDVITNLVNMPVGGSLQSKGYKLGPLRIVSFGCTLTGPVTGDVRISFQPGWLPPNSALVQCGITETGANYFQATSGYALSGDFYPAVAQANGTFTKISATFPHTWKSTDTLSGTFLWMV